MVTLVGGRTCPDCGKIRYATRKLAKLAIRQRHPGEAMNPYRCESSDGWHIGHLPQDVRTGRQKNGRNIYRRAAT